MQHGTAPGAHILFASARSCSNTDLENSPRNVVDHHLANVVTNYVLVGLPVPDYPAFSPRATAVGGTTLQVGSAGRRLGEFGWSTASERRRSRLPASARDGRLA